MQLILDNLIKAGCALLIFVIAYATNMVASLYHNIGQIKQEFDWKKLVSSLIKALCICISIALFTVGITIMPYFAQFVAWDIPEEFTELFTGMVIIVSVMYAACRYFAEAATKIIAIFDFNKQKNQEATFM